ncbi:hypothetical protein [Abyssibacter profundi]|uniref:DUF2069 domain-containing protein n=1 Tax=Abyssibacter profundi TaxID=2182787 RepID=A0A363UJF5_9GAMM|nr:hypothetical protein [Abyssibacter profundi]PWN55556.1 hypothetical protein DEH80_12260 [Abyssibacter profundi]
MSALWRRFIASNQSFMRLPLWVRVWILGGLGLVNAAALLLTHWPTGYWASWALAAIIAINLPMVLIQQGYSRALAIPHLLVWIPLCAYAALRLTATEASDGERVYAALLLAVNGTSVAFDLFDSWRWLRGDRAVA